MATETQPRATEAAWKPYRLSARQFLAMIDAGIFPEGAHVELLGGVLVEQMTKNNAHDFTVSRLGRLLARVLPEPWFAREEKSITLGRSWRPEPDLVVLRGPDDNYRDRSPTAKDIGFLVEVSASSAALDRGPKLRRYAAAGIPVYWIVHLSKRQVEVYRDPSGRGRSAGYRRADTFGIDAEAPVEIDGREVGRVAVRDVLP